jgi:putative metal-binding protein
MPKLSSSLLLWLCIFCLSACGGSINSGPEVTIDDVDADRDNYCNQEYLDHELCPNKTVADCNDGNANINPGAVESCDNQVDDNCDGDTDEDCECQQKTLYQDSDQDTFGDPASSLTVCQDENPTGYVADNTDCDDQSADVNPGASEVCGNSVDENCNDELELDVVFYRDQDGDTFGNPDVTSLACPGPPPQGYVADNTDCDDDDPNRYPGAGGANDCAAIIEVANSSELHNALQNAGPGATINIHSGIYVGEFYVEVSGEGTNCITIRGPADLSAILDGDFDVSSWQGVLNIISQHCIVVENLEIRNTSPSRYGVQIGATSQTADGCYDIILRNLLVHDTGEEIIKIQGRNSHDILVENCTVHTNQDYSGIDVQGHWGGTPPYDQKPRRVIIRNNLIYNIQNFAGVGNEVADQIHVYNNVVLGSWIGLDIGCGNYNLIHNNLITSYEHFNALLQDSNYTAIDLSAYQPFSQAEINGFFHQKCHDGIALSGNYMSLVFDNEITDCTSAGDMIMSYDHWLDGQRHNYDHINDIDYGHRSNLFFRNKIHHNDAYKTIEEFKDSMPLGVTYDNMYFNNLFAENNSSQDIKFKHSEGLLFFNNTIVSGDNLELQEESINATIKNNILYDSGYSLSGDSSPAEISNNHETSDPTVFTDLAGGDYHLNPDPGNPCSGTGADLSVSLAARFQAFDDIYSTKFAYYDDFDIEFDFSKDFDGQTQAADWDIGAYVGQ